MDETLVKRTPIESQIQAQQGSPLFFVATFILFLLTLAVYGGLVFLNKSQQKAQEETAAQVASREQDLRPELSNQILALDAQLKNIKLIFTGRPFPSNVIKLLEADTYPNVQFLTFGFSTDARTLTTAGQAASYTALTQQIGLFERDPRVENVEFGGLNLGLDNLVTFRMTITFKPSLLTLQP